MPLLPSLGSATGLAFPLLGRTLNCPLFESGGIENRASSKQKADSFRPTMSGALKLRVFNTLNIPTPPASTIITYL